MATDLTHVTTRFFAASRALAWHSGSLQERLADAFADHLLQVIADDLPPELREVFRDLEHRMNAVEADGDEDDPFQAAARRLTDAEAQELIEHIVVLYGRLTALAAP